MREVGEAGCNVVAQGGLSYQEGESERLSIYYRKTYGVGELIKYLICLQQQQHVD